MSLFPVMKSALRSRRVNATFSRCIHATAFKLNENSEMKRTTSSDDVDNSDTLKHLYTKKYEFIQKQNLEDSYNQFHKENPQGESSSSSSRDEKTFQLTQRIKLLSAGLATVVLTLVGLQVFQNWSFIKSEYFGDELESFDEMYDRIKEKKQKKQQRLETYSTTITNPNDSSVPGVYICGNNKNGLVTEDSQYDYVPIFKRLDVFDNFIVKDLAIGSKSGALINDKGDLYQWGSGFGGNSKEPTIKGKKLKKVQISNETLYVLSDHGEVFYLPENFKLQNEIKNIEKGWFRFYKANYFKLDVPSKSKIADISAGLQHIVLLDNNGSVFTSATGYETEIVKSFGQFGLPEFSQFDKPPKINEVYDVVLLNKYMKNGQLFNRQIKKISAGDNFTLCLDKAGTVWAFGQNTHGAIGSAINYDSEIIPYPKEVNFFSTHFKRNELPRCINIEAGGDTAFATFTSSNIYELFEKSLKKSNKFDESFNFDDLDVAEDNNLHLSWGHGLKGELGLGYFIHGSYEPKKIKVLNEIKEFKEATNTLERIGIKKWTVGEHHSVVTLENNDVYAWGDNEYGQLGNGKRIRSGAPSIPPSLLEPNTEKKTKFAKFNNRLQLFDNGKIHQEIVAGRDTTAIVYKKS